MTPHLSSAFLDIDPFEVMVLHKTRSRRRPPVFAAFLAHLLASGEALALSATRVFPEAARRPWGRQAAFEARRTTSVLAVEAAASIPNLTAYEEATRISIRATLRGATLLFPSKRCCESRTGGRRRLIPGITQSFRVKCSTLLIILRLRFSSNFVVLSPSYRVSLGCVIPLP